MITYRWLWLKIRVWITTQWSKRMERTSYTNDLTWIKLIQKGILYIKGMECLCARGMDWDLTFWAGYPQSGHRTGRPNRWLPSGSRDRLRPPEGVMLTIPNGAIPWIHMNPTIGMEHGSGFATFHGSSSKKPWMNVWTLKWLSISRTRNRDITKKSRGFWCVLH